MWISNVKQYTFLLVMFLFAISRCSFALGLNVLESTNQKQLVLAVYFIDEKAEKRKAEADSRSR
jgi:hypothetical protein